VGRVYQQTFMDTYTKVVCGKLHDRKTPITAAAAQRSCASIVRISRRLKVFWIMTHPFRNSDFA
jgi:hypothetical protein